MPKYVVTYRWVETVYVEAASARHAAAFADRQEMDRETLELDPFGTAIRLATPAEIEACNFRRAEEER
jgi:hypothetical protein